jgi:hypothetical protein
MLARIAVRDASAAFPRRWLRAREKAQPWLNLFLALYFFALYF